MSSTVVLGKGICKIFICTTPTFRLPMSNGSRVYMDWHNYLGPTFFKDRNCTREIVNWWENPFICQALDWFLKRGYRA